MELYSCAQPRFETYIYLNMLHTLVCTCTSTDQGFDDFVIELLNQFTSLLMEARKICKLNKTQNLSMLASIRDSRGHVGGEGVRNFLEDLLNSHICYCRSNMPWTPLADTIISSIPPPPYPRRLL